MYILIFILAVLAVLLLSAKRPATAFAFWLCSYGFEQWLQSRDVFFNVHSTAVNLVAAGTVLIAVAVKFIKEKRVLKNYPVEGWLIIALFSYAAASVIWSPVPETASENLVHNLPYIVITVLLAPVLINSSDDLYDALLSMIALGGGVVVLLLFFTPWEYRTIVLANNWQFGQANPLVIADLAGYVMLSVALLHTKARNRSWVLVRWLLVVICLALAVRTGSRGQFLAMVLAALMFLPASRSVNQFRQYLPLLFAIIIVTLAAYWAMWRYSGEDIRWDETQMSADLGGRYGAASTLIQHWYSSPETLLFGLGGSASYDPSIVGFYTHVVPLEILGELGLIGFFMFLAILYMSFNRYRKSLRFVGEDMTKKGALVAITAITTFELLLSFKQGSLLGSPILFGLLIVMSRFGGSLEREVFEDTKIDKTRPSDAKSKAARLLGVKSSK